MKKRKKERKKDRNEKERNKEKKEAKKESLKETRIHFNENISAKPHSYISTVGKSQNLERLPVILVFERLNIHLIKWHQRCAIFKG